MNKPIIAVDIDDVLADHIGAFIKWSNEKHNTNLTIEDYQENLSQMWKISAGEAEDRAHNFHSSTRGGFNPKAGSKEVLNRLKTNYNLVIITARRQFIFKDTVEWINEYFEGVFTDIHFVPVRDNASYHNATKLTICHDIKAEYLIDDTPRHCFSVAEAGINALLFGDFNWSRHMELPDGVSRVKDWDEVERYFDDIKHKQHL